MLLKIKNRLMKNIIINDLNKLDRKYDNLNIGCVIFSMDRVMQLDALLSSMFELTDGVSEVSVIYRATTSEHEESYRDIKKKFNGKVHFLAEENLSFKENLLMTLREMNSSRVFFLVDDIVFIRKFDFTVLRDVNSYETIFSLRMGEHLNYSYVVQRRQKLPGTLRREKGFLWWDWSEGELDWSYPLSVDGHIFSRSEMIILAKSLEYRAPNSFENSMQALKGYFSRRRGMSCSDSIILNIPCNRVQNEVGNISGDIDPNYLLEMWNKGYRIDPNCFYNYKNTSVHEEVPFSYKGLGDE